MYCVTQGHVIGMWGSKIFSLNDSQVSVIEVALSVPLYQYLERKCFRYVGIKQYFYILILLIFLF